MSTAQPPTPVTHAAPHQNGTGDWFDYRVRVQPHHTDYGGIVWHGSYIAWMEEARVEYLRSFGVAFSDLVQMGCDLPVVDLSLRYHQSVQMGMEILVSARLGPLKGVRILWDYRIQSLDRQELYVSGQVVLVAIDREKRRIMRRLPPELTQMWQ